MLVHGRPSTRVDIEACVSPALWKTSVSISEDRLSASSVRRRVVLSTVKLRKWTEGFLAESVTTEVFSSSLVLLVLLVLGRRDTRQGWGGTSNTLVFRGRKGEEVKKAKEKYKTQSETGTQGGYGMIRA